eukprot:Sspe_Gene.25608::Locus_10330_Transcript_4_4_Confidence_0.400_Length_2326::g.25608::m.25608
MQPTARPGRGVEVATMAMHTAQGTRPTARTRSLQRLLRQAPHQVHTPPMSTLMLHGQQLTSQHLWNLRQQAGQRCTKEDMMVHTVLMLQEEQVAHMPLVHPLVMTGHLALVGQQHIVLALVGHTVPAVMASTSSVVTAALALLGCMEVGAQEEHPVVEVEEKGVVQVEQRMVQ